MQSTFDYNYISDELPIMSIDTVDKGVTVGKDTFSIIDYTLEDSSVYEVKRVLQDNRIFVSYCMFTCKANSMYDSTFEIFRELKLQGIDFLSERNYRYNAGLRTIYWFEVPNFEEIHGNDFILIEKYENNTLNIIWTTEQL